MSLQRTPLRAKSVGVSLPLWYVAWNPNWVEPPVAMLPLWGWLRAVTAVPDCVTSAFQPEVTCWSPVNVHVSAQLVTAAALLVTVTWATKPPVHWSAW
ncbi:hypothetical protein GCM10029964_066280 [Kibdelosporangium lantanae]